LLERDVQVGEPLPKLRVGIVNFLNSKPLAWGFLKGHHADLFAPTYHPPAMVARLLGQGALDIGLIPSIEVQRIPGLKVLPDLCIASRHEVKSVLLVSRGPLEQVRKVALDQNSRTSVALVRILLQERGIHPEYVHERPDPERMLSEADAALLIGDPALKVEREKYQVIDLAAEWNALTGLPFVFAVWAVRAGVDLPDLPFYFKSSLRYGLSSIDTVSRESAAELGLDSADVVSYLTENLSYFLRQDELAGLEEFYRRAHAHGLILEPKPLEFLE
ncbi:MAG TPA: menaquinone biosynthesis protein, partial [Thermoanaerobaculia bacterium]|nr:menaquinone biosynthesis protein [Thermoanaerobaculia bacterium]